VLPRVVFATSDFQVTTQHGIQGIRAGDALNFLREEGEDYVVETGGLEFRKNKTYFAATYVEPPRPQASPVAGETVAVASPSPEPSLPEEPPLGAAVPSDNPAILSEQKKVGELADSIRHLNDRIRSAQDDLDKLSAKPAEGEKPSPQDLKKASRAILKLKAERDELSGQLTKMGKP
jgi:hypothetical protein